MNVAVSLISEYCFCARLHDLIITADTRVFYSSLRVKTSLELRALITQDAESTGVTHTSDKMFSKSES